MNFDQAVTYLKSYVSYEDLATLQYSEEFFNLERYRKFLKAYGVRYRDLRCVHVAGSKGKGTTSWLVAEYLARAGGGVGDGAKVGLFTSPYLIDATESFFVGGGRKGKMRGISKADFVRRVERVREFLDEWADRDKGRYVTYFEILFALVMEYFLEVGVDFAVVEVGLGGRLDATNVVRPVVTALTTVEKEHTEVLGSTYRQILGEKLGIVKEGVPLVVAPQRVAVLGELVKMKFDVPVAYVDGKVGDNYAVAREILWVMVEEGVIDGFDEEVFREVFDGLQIPGRFDVRSLQVRTPPRGGDNRLVFDMAHTIESAKVLRKGLEREFSGKEFVYLISMMKGKNVGGFLKGLGIGVRGAGVKAVFTSSHEVRGMSGAELEKIAGFGEACEDWAEAFARAKKGLKKDQVLVVTGSHFLVGKILKTL